jgi:hypothetical protein
MSHVLPTAVCTRCAVIALLCWVCDAGLAAAQRAAEPPPAVVPASAAAAADEAFGPETVTRIRIGAKVAAPTGAVPRLVVYMAVPLECPEQAVAKLDEDASSGAAIEYRQPNPGVRQMVITFSDLAAGDEAHATATFEVRTRTVLPPTDTDGLKIPKRIDRTLRPYLAKSPLIDANHRLIKTALTEAWNPFTANGGATDWQRVEALYDYALKHVVYKLGDDKSSLAALADGVGDCQAISAVFVALCRTAKVPARMVWVDGHQYAEFYLESAAGQGGWHPVESAGTRAFGGMPLARVILQKGDAIRVPERPREQLRYASDYALLPVAPQGAPQVTYVRERLE